MPRPRVSVEQKKAKGYYRPSRHGTDPDAPKPLLLNVPATPPDERFMQPFRYACDDNTAGVSMGKCMKCGKPTSHH